MRWPGTCLRLAAGLLLLAMLAKVHAVEVTLCNHEAQLSSGPNVMNLNTALAIGGHITFHCPGPSTLLVATTHFIAKDTDIDGDNVVTLDGGNNRFGMFSGANDSVAFGLTRLKVVRGGRAPNPSIPGQVTNLGRNLGGVVEGKFRAVELQTVSIEHSWFAVLLTAGTLRVRDSSFANNDGSVLFAGSIDVGEHSRFTANRGSPLQGRTVVIDRSDFFSNSEPVRVTEGSLKVYGANFTNNGATGSGGALRTGVDATIEESDFRNNIADDGGAIFIGAPAGKVVLRAVRFEGNSSRNRGGAIALEHSEGRLDVTMAHVTFQDNRAVSGGAVSLERGFRNNATLNGGAVAFVGNVATDSGGGIFAPNASVQLSRGVFIGNRAGNTGGAIAAFQQGDRVTSLANSLLVRNTATQGAAFWGNAATFINTTIADNNGTAVWPQPVPFGPLPGKARSFPIKFANTIVTGAALGPDACGQPIATAPYTTGGTNLQFPGASCGSELTIAYPLLGAYYVPFFLSPALNAGSNAICDAPPISHTDVYNTRRPRGGVACAIGAVEGDISQLVRRWTHGERNLLFRR